MIASPLLRIRASRLGNWGPKWLCNWGPKSGCVTRNSPNMEKRSAVVEIGIQYKKTQQERAISKQISIAESNSTAFKYRKSQSITIGLLTFPSSSNVELELKGCVEPNYAKGQRVGAYPRPQYIPWFDRLNEPKLDFGPEV